MTEENPKISYNDAAENHKLIPQENQQTIEWSSDKRLSEAPNVSWS